MEGKSWKIIGTSKKNCQHIPHLNSREVAFSPVIRERIFYLKIKKKCK
jgi:hypothetical protein